MLEDQIINLFNHLGHYIQNISFVGKGEGSRVYKVVTNRSKFCLKLAQYPERTEKVLKEADIRQYFITNGLECLPSPIHSDQHFLSYGAVIYHFIEGNIPDFNDQNNLKQMAEILASIHRLNIQVVPQGYKQLIKYFEYLKKTITRTTQLYTHLMNEFILSGFRKVLEEISWAIDAKHNAFTHGLTSILHGDLSDNFILDQDGKIWLIDWENSEPGDVVEEICSFVYDNKVTHENKIFFFKEYQKHCPQAQTINFDEIEPLYNQSVPVFNICWGIDLLNTNLERKLEPERKLRDLAISANNWKKKFSEKTSIKMIQGIEILRKYLMENYH
ncbi:MAG: aminoglycoside phosphotransferase family protein [Candidatus Hodarchaeales archaeon]